MHNFIILAIAAAAIAAYFIATKALKHKEPQPRRLVVPEEHTRRILELWDDYRDSHDGRSVRRYDLWTAIHEVLPETKVGGWDIVLHRATQITLVEILP